MIFFECRSVLSEIRSRRLSEISLSSKIKIVHSFDHDLEKRSGDNFSILERYASPKDTNSYAI